MSRPRRAVSRETTRPYGYAPIVLLMTRQSGPVGASVVQEDAMPETYTLPNGETRTTCGAHRTVGYYVSGHLFGQPVWACRDCGAVMAWHESTDETVARNRAAAVLV